MKKLKYFAIFIFCLFAFIPNAFASSEYYDHIWTSKYHELDQYVHGINDVLKTDNGFVAIGGMEPFIYTFDENGTLLSAKEVEDVYSLRKILSIDGKNYAISSSVQICPATEETSARAICPYYIYFLEFDNNGNVVDTKKVLDSSYYSIGVMDEVTAIESDEYVYIFSGSSNYFSKLRKDFSSIERVYDASDEDKEIVFDYFLAVSSGTLVGEYDGGYISYIDKYEEGYEGYYNHYITSTFNYYKDGEVVWSFDYGVRSYTISYPSVISYNGNVLFSFYNEDYDAVLLYVDSNGKILKEDKVSDYFLNVEDFYYFKPQHVIQSEYGFFLSGSYMYTPEDESTFDEYNAEKQEVLMYFSEIYDITSTTDSNGSIEVVSQALYGDMITFRVAPRTGYKLSTLSVTNEALETVVFTEDDLILNDDGTVSVSVNSFTMPRSNIAITASFEKITENPNTIDNIVFYTGMFIVSIALISGLVVYRRRYS